MHQPVQGVYYWRTPTGHWYQVDHRGTTHLGRDRPTALDTAARHDPSTMTTHETHLRDRLLRHLAA